MTERIDRDGIYTSAQVAHLLLGHDVEWFYTYRRTTGLRERFPKPISGRGHPRWSGAALLDWRDRPSRDLPALVPQDGSSNLVDIRERLRQRSMALATGGRKRLSR